MTETPETPDLMSAPTNDGSFVVEDKPAIGSLRLDETLGKQLPQGRQIYTRLREGSHLSADSPDQFALYKELEQNRDSYTHLFALLGYELIYHPDGFFYFVYPDSVTGQSLSTSRKVALLIYTLIDFLQDNNYDPAATITGEAIDIRLIDDTRRHFSDLYEQADLATMDAVTTLLEWMARRGFCQFASDEHIRFLKPISRFLEAAEQVAESGMMTDDDLAPASTDEQDENEEQHMIREGEK